MGGTAPESCPAGSGADPILYHSGTGPILVAPLVARYDAQQFIHNDERMKSVEVSVEDKRLKNVGIWIRVSTENQAQGDSPEHHEKRARYYAESKGWNVAEVYHLEGLTGKSVMAYTETQRMLKDIQKGRISGLIFSKLARVARNTKELLDFADLFRDANADLISLQESIDTSSPAGRLFYTMIAAMAQWEREEIASRVAASVPIRAKLGKPLGGSAPFGYQWKEKKLVVNSEEAPIRKLVYDLFIQHRRVKRVARLLNEAGHRTRSGAKFCDATVRRMIQDPSAKGQRRANYTKSLGDGKGWQLKPEDDWVYTDVEPIISEELWNQANRLLDDRKNGQRPAKKAVQLFGGLVWCHCGTKMYVISNSPKYVCQKCRNKMLVEDLDGIFHEQLKGFLFSPEDIAQYLEGADQTIKEKEELLKTLESDQTKVKAEMDKLYRLYLDSELSSKGFGERNKPLEVRLEQIGEELPALQGEIDFLKVKLQSSDQIIREAQDLYARWPSLLHEEKRNIVETITERITIGENEVSIDLLYLPSAEMMAKGQHNPMAVTPFCKVRLRGQKSPPPPLPGYPQTLQTIGDHIRKRRLDLRLSMRALAEQLGVDTSAIFDWEKHRRPPAAKHLPRLYAFLGYQPEPEPQTFPQKVRHWRQTLGLSQIKLSEALGLNHSAVCDWENGTPPTKESLDRLCSFLKAKLGKEVFV